MMADMKLVTGITCKVYLRYKKWKLKLHQTIDGITKKIRRKLVVFIIIKPNRDEIIDE